MKREEDLRRVLTELGVITLVQEQLPVDLVDDDVPRVDGACAAHDRGQDDVRGEDVALALLGQLQNQSP